jgi:vacuolar-type H+-ATPase subunit I/STV1
MWVITGFVVALYAGIIRPQERNMGINNSRASGLAAERMEPLGLWHRTRIAGMLAGIPDADKSVNYIPNAVRSVADSRDAEADRKMVRTATLEMLVQHPAETAEKIRVLAEREGGFLVSSEVRGQEYPVGGTLTIRVPTERFENVRDQIRKLGLRVESERTEAQDVTRQYTDQDANLRNLRAEEQQYLLILKQARTVKDTLEVSEKLSQVRGQIEQQQAEFNALSKQIETVAITIYLRAEAEARVFGLNWRPLYQIKIASRDGLDGLANYFSSITAFVFFLPTILLWAATIMLSGVGAWRILRWVARRWFGWGGVHQSAATPAG